MTRSREHWTDDLIEAVRDGMSVETLAVNDGEAIVRFTYIPRDDDVNNVIAAVEDWQQSHDLCPSCIGAMGAGEAIQRVRVEVNGDQPIPRASDDLDNVAAYCAGYVDALRRVRLALDGERDE